MPLHPISIEPVLGPIPQEIGEWIPEALAIGKSVDCFEYIPSCAELLYGFLSIAPGKTYCEWGSGIGIGVGIASMLGFQATGIEIDEELANRSRELLQRRNANASIICGSYLEIDVIADVVFVYCWPGQLNTTRQRFEDLMPVGTWILIAEGAERFSAHLQVSNSV